MTRSAPRVQIDEGLRAYMLDVYNYMTGGLAMIGAVAYGVSTSELALQIIFSTPLFWVVVMLH